MANFFADFSAGSDGSGSAGSPWNTLVGKTATSSDVIWIRRAGQMTLPAASTFHFNQACAYIGWPKAGDVIPSAITVPSAPTGWAADAADYAVFASTNNTALVALDNFKFLHRLKFSNTSVTSTTTPFVTLSHQSTFDSQFLYFTSNQNTLSISGNIFQRIYSAFVESIASTAPALYVAYPGASTQGPCILFVNGAFKNSASAGAGASMIDLEFDTQTQFAFYACTFTCLGNQRGIILRPGAGGDRSTRVTFMDCTFDDSGRSGSSNGPLIQAECSSFARNAKVNTRSGVSIGLSGGNRPSWWQFTKFDQTASFSPAVNVTGAGTVVSISNFSPNGSTTTPFAVEQCSKLRLTNGTTTLRKANILIKDQSGTLESWRRVSLGGDAIKSSVARSGGAPNAVQMTFDIDANEKHPVIFSEPGRETIWVALNVGGRTLTCFFATKGYSSITGDDFWFEFEYYDRPNSTHRKTISTRGFLLQTDSSTWTGDTGLTIYSVSVVVNNRTTGIFPVRFFLRKYQTSTKVYVDPKVQVI